MPKLATVTMKLDYLFENWRPGSYDWSWDEEFADIMSQATTEAVRKRVKSEGIGFADSFAPVLLGNDGRVWDGHHRICVARELGIAEVEVELA